MVHGTLYTLIIILGKRSKGIVDQGVFRGVVVLNEEPWRYIIVRLGYRRVVILCDYDSFGWGWMVYS